MTRPTRFPGTMLLGTALAYCALSPVTAATSSEEKLRNASMPHADLDVRNGMVKVHLVQLQGYLEGEPGNAIRLVQLQDEVKKCLADHVRDGASSTPPVQLPDYLTSMREDIYFAANRSIRYATGIAYAVNYTDCGLIEGRTSTALLVSSQGICKIDLMKKSATGVCPANGHASAAVSSEKRESVASRSALHDMENQNRLAESIAARQVLHTSGSMRTGEKKTIAGVQCEVWNEPAIAGGGTMCFARGGSFTPARSAGNQALAGVLLEEDSKFGVKRKAVEVKFDVDVSVRVFTPYRAWSRKSNRVIAASLPCTSSSRIPTMKTSIVIASWT